MDLNRQLVFLMVLAIPIASIAWAVTHEEVFRETREWCVSRSKNCGCVTAAFLYITRYRLLFDDWQGYVIAGFSLVAVANLYMSLFGRLPGEIKEEQRRPRWPRQRVARPMRRAPFVSFGATWVPNCSTFIGSY